eukprot:9715903-Alexandrium_andersonii.AAC.1
MGRGAAVRGLPVWSEASRCTWSPTNQKLDPYLTAQCMTLKGAVGQRGMGQNNCRPPFARAQR